MSVHSRMIAAFDGADPTCNLHWIGVQLGHDGSTASLEQYVAQLIADEGFPPPLPHLKHGGGLSRSVSYRRSQWIRAGVLAWLGHFLPPSASTAIEAADLEAAAREMDTAATHLQLVASNDQVAA